MRGLMAAVIGMGVLIVAGVTGLVVTMMQRMSAVSAPNASATALALDEPEGTRIAGAALGPDRMAVQLSGGGPDRVVIVDTKSGRVVGRVGLAR